MPFAARVVAVLPVILSWSYYMAMPYTGGLGVLGLGTAAWFLLACGLIVWAEVFRAEGPSSGRLHEKQGLGLRLHRHSAIRGPYSGGRSHQPAATYHDAGGASGTRSRVRTPGCLREPLPLGLRISQLELIISDSR